MAFSLLLTTIWSIASTFPKNDSKAIWKMYRAKFESSVKNVEFYADVKKVCRKIEDTSIELFHFSD